MSKGIPRQSRQVVDPLRTNVNLNTLQSLPKQASQLSVKNVQPQDVIEANDQRARGRRCAAREIGEVQPALSQATAA